MLEKKIEVSISIEQAIFWSAFVVAISFLLWFFQFAISYSHDWEYPYKISEYGLVKFVVDHYINVNGRVPIHLAISLLGDHYSFWKFLHAVMLCVFPIYQNQDNINFMRQLKNSINHASVPFFWMRTGVQ